MGETTKTYAKIQPRHVRYLFFIDSTISEANLRSIMQANMEIWGGRYNPIVPVYNNDIPEDWINIIKYYDPDYIYYSDSLDLAYLKSLNLFWPKEYLELRNDSRHYFEGVSSHCLIHEHVHNFLIANRSCLLFYDDDYSMQMLAKEFYQLNLGFRRMFQEENKWTHRLNAVTVNRGNAKEINTVIRNERPYFKTLLSALHVNSIYLHRSKAWQDSRFEFIIYENNNFLNDLLYFWNRQLYFKPDNLLYQVIASEEEMNEFLADSTFPDLLQVLSIENHVSFVSQSIKSDILNTYKDAFQGRVNLRFDIKSAFKFPFPPSEPQYISDNYFKYQNNLLLGKSDYLRFPILSFENGDGFDNHQYLLDLILERDTNERDNKIKFPLQTELHFTVCKDLKTRVNKQHFISIYIIRELQGVTISVPSSFEIVQSVLIYQMRSTELVTLPTQYVQVSPAGQKLLAFYKLFKEDWSTVEEYLKEKFWLYLFQYRSEVDDSAIPSGKGIFHYLELKKEVGKLFDKYRGQIGEKMTNREGATFDNEFVSRIIERDKKEVFEYHIDQPLNFLIRQGAVFTGMKIKCEHCGSNIWYSLPELQNKFPCKGCNSEIMADLSSKVYYKFSDTIINNLLSDPRNSHKQYDGNYVVLKTLIHLKNDSQQTQNSFAWTPCLDIVWQDGTEKKKTDIDIVAIQNGQLVLGEAKDDAKEFYNDDKRKLIWMADHIRPDKIIVACRIGNIEKVAEDIRQGITNKNCVIITYKPEEPRYWIQGLFGLGQTNQDAS